MLRRDRAGNLLWVALGTLFIASLGVAMLVRVTRTGSRQVALAKHESEARWAAHAALAGFANRLKMRPWPERFYAKAGTEYNTTLGYRGRAVSLWARDSVRASQLQTGTTDVFVKVVEGDLVMGMFQRLRITPAVATNPRALRVVRELTVREDLEPAAARDRLLASIEEDEKLAQEGAAGAEVAARAMDDAAARDASVEEAVSAARAARGEEPAERRFRETLVKARQKAQAADLAGAVTALQDAVGQAGGGGSIHSAQRRQAAELALARAQYALALSVTEPERSARLGDAVVRLDGLVNDLGTGCAGPSAAYLRAQTKVFQSRAAAGATAGPAERARIVQDVTNQLKGALARIVPGTAYEGGMIEVAELPQQFERTWTMPVAYTDSFFELRRFNFLFVSIPIPWPVLQRIVVTDDRGTEARTLTVSGMQQPLLWVADGQALIAKDFGRQSGFSLVMLDRTGTVIRGFKELSPDGNRTSGGVWLTPKGDAMIAWGTVLGRDEGQSYWHQDLEGGRPRRLLGPFGSKEKEVASDYDPIAFSPDGRHVAFVDFANGVKVAPSTGFLEGARGGTQVWRLSGGEKTLAPSFGWVTAGAHQLLVVAPHPEDTGHPDAGRLIAHDPASGATIKGALPPGFKPGLVLPHRGSPRVTVLDDDGKQFVTLPVSLAGIGAADAQALAGGPYGSRPGRGAGDVVYLTGGQGGARLSRWDMAGGTAPVKMPVPEETGPTKLHTVFAPVSF